MKERKKVSEEGAMKLMAVCKVIVTAIVHFLFCLVYECELKTKYI